MIFESDHPAILASVDRVPRTASELYRRWRGLTEHQALTHHHKKDRRWFAHVLYDYAMSGEIMRDQLKTDGGGTYVTFWCTQEQLDSRQVEAA